MIVVALEVEIYLPGRRNLKEKRKTMRALMDGVFPKFGAAAAEVDAQEIHQRGVVGLALVGGTPSEVRDRTQALLEALRSRVDLEVLRVGQTETQPEPQLESP